MQNHSKKGSGNRRHSKLGIASALIAILIPLVLVIFFFAVVALDVRKNTIGSYIAGVGLIFSVVAPLLHLVGGALGLAGIFSKTRLKFYPVVGLILNILLGTSGVLLWILVLSNLKFGFR